MGSGSQRGVHRLLKEGELFFRTDVGHISRDDKGVESLVGLSPGIVVNELYGAFEAFGFGIVPTAFEVNVAHDERAHDDGILGGLCESARNERERERGGSRLQETATRQRMLRHGDIPYFFGVEGSKDKRDPTSPLTRPDRVAPCHFAISAICWGVNAHE